MREKEVPAGSSSDAAVLGSRVNYDSATGRDTMQKTIALLERIEATHGTARGDQS